MSLTKKDVTDELKSHIMNQNWQDLEKLINAKAETMNPFSGLIDKNYRFNIATGKAAQEETATFLLDVIRLEAKHEKSSLKTVSKILPDFLNPSKDK